MRIPLPLAPDAAPASPPPRVDAGALDLLALLPCPLKVPLDALLDGLAAGHPALRLSVEGNANHEGDLLARLSRADGPGALPGAVVSPGLNPLFHAPFRSRFLDTGEVACLGPPEPGERFRALGLAEGADGWSMLGMNLLVLVVDEAALEGRPAPRAVADLLSPAWARSVAIRGNRDGSFCETLLLAVHARHGDAGIAALARATRHGWHPSQMVKAAGSGRPDAPAASVMPRFFAETLRGRAGVRIVWPEDGAVVSPVTLLVKAARRDALAPVVDLLTGPEAGRIFSGALLPSLRADVPDGLPSGAPLHWIGWDRVRAQDLGALLARLNALFRRHCAAAVPA